MGMGFPPGVDVFGGQGVAVVGEEQWTQGGYEQYGQDLGGGTTFFGTGPPKMPWREMGAQVEG